MKQTSRPQTLQTSDSFGDWTDQDGNSIDLVSPIAERTRSDATWIEGRTMDLGAENDFEWIPGAGSSRYVARLVFNATPVDNPWYASPFDITRPSVPDGETAVLRAVVGKPAGTGPVAAQVFTPGLSPYTLDEIWLVDGNGASEGDTYRLTIDGAQWTDPLAWDATAGAVRSVLAALDRAQPSRSRCWQSRERGPSSVKKT